MDMNEFFKDLQQEIDNQQIGDCLSFHAQVIASVKNYFKSVKSFWNKLKWMTSLSCRVLFNA